MLKPQWIFLNRGNNTFWEKAVLRQWNALCLTIARCWRCSECNLLGLCCWFFALGQSCLFAAQLVHLLFECKCSCWLVSACWMTLSMSARYPCLFWFKTGAIGLDVLAAVTEELLVRVALSWSYGQTCLQSRFAARWTTKRMPELLGLCLLCKCCMCFKYAGVTGETGGSLTEREGLWRGAVSLQPN